MNIIRVAVSGACGRMGQEVVRTIIAQEDMQLVGAVDAKNEGKDAASLAGCESGGVLVRLNLAATLSEAKPHVLVDFTRGDVAVSNIRTAIEHGVACVVGTTGIPPEALKSLQELSAERKVGVLIAPNFALGAVLMMHFAQQAAQHYDWAEIIELHHENKVDAPSGTALRTAEKIRKACNDRSCKLGEVTRETDSLGSRGGMHEGVHIHSVRLPGLVAHQEVIFGGSGETFTIRHDSISRASFMPGVMLGIRHVLKCHKFTIGLEHVLGL